MSNAHRSVPGDVIAREMKAGYERLFRVIQTTEFQAVLEKVYGLPLSERPGFVKEYLLSEEGRRSLGLLLPPDVLLLRSTFGDRRPTLFCLKTYLPDECQAPWQNVNVTFDIAYDDREVPKDERAWRLGLPFDVQAALMSSGFSVDEVVNL